VEDGASVLLKLPLPDSASDVLRHEHALLRRLAVPEILQPIALLEEGPQVALGLEPFAGEVLDTVLARQQRFALQATLTIARQLTRALAALHAAGIVHRDLRPINVLLVHDSLEVKLADLSQAVERDGAASVRAAVIGDWAYASPEQTGRMNRQPDYRTDFYSLGVVLYRLLTGQLPFQANDPLEWAHCHLARTPAPVHVLAPDVPRVVARARHAGAQRGGAGAGVLTGAGPRAVRPRQMVTMRRGTGATRTRGATAGGALS